MNLVEQLKQVQEALDKGGFHATARGNIADAIEISIAISLLPALIAHAEATNNGLPKSVGIGGNHLASALSAKGIDPVGERNLDYYEFLEKHGQPWADIFIAWKAIMDWRNSAQREGLYDI